MHIKLTYFVSSFLFFFCISLWGQEIKLPLEIKAGHLSSVCYLKDSIRTKVFLETGFPKIVISQSFAQKNLKDLKTEVASQDAYITLWGNQEKVKVSYFIKDTIKINNTEKIVEALVADFSTINSWKEYDIIYPIRDLSEVIEINIKDNYMIVDKSLKDINSDFIKLQAKIDEKTKGLYIRTTLQIYDTLNTQEKLKGNFLLDLGAANAIFINRNLPQVEKFVINSDRFILKDSTKFKPNPQTKLSIIMPDKLQIKHISLKNNFVVAMKMFKSEKSSKYVGMIGNKFFTNFVMIFDFKNNDIYLKPNSENVTIK